MTRYQNMLDLGGYLCGILQIVSWTCATLSLPNNE